MLMPFACLLPAFCAPQFIAGQLFRADRHQPVGRNGEGRTGQMEPTGRMWEGYAPSFQRGS